MGREGGQGPGAASAGWWEDADGCVMRYGARAPLVVQAHLHSAVSRCSEVWSLAPPPSARIGSGHSGTARTLRRQRQGGAAGPQSHPVEAPVHGSLPCSTCRWLMAPRMGFALHDPSAPCGTALCIHAPGQPTGNGTQPSRGNGKSRA